MVSVNSSPHARAIRDAYPIAEGHTLVIPNAHVKSVFDLPAEALRDLWDLVSMTRQRLVDEFGSEAFTIGVNDGEAAGQTVAHAHVHVIPRKTGDVADPRGGVRWVIPKRANYWEP